MNATKLESLNKSIEDAKKEDKEIDVKKAASKKKAVEKRKATSELRKAVTTAVRHLLTRWQRDSAILVQIVDHVLLPGCMNPHFEWLVVAGVQRLH